MARKPRHDLAQACRPRKLAVEQRHKLPLRRQSPHACIRIMLFHKSFEPIPRHKLQNVSQYCIVMRHGADLQSCSGTLADVQNRLESTPCALSTKSKPDSRGLVPGIHVFGASSKKDVDGGVKPGHDEIPSMIH